MTMIMTERSRLGKTYKIFNAKNPLKEKQLTFEPQ
jgi:hypothetical protein